MAEEKKKKEKKPQSKAKKIVNWVITGVFGAIIVGVIIFNLVSRFSGTGYIFGSQYPMVLTDSMEDDYMVGDVLNVRKIKNYDALADSYRYGDDKVEGTADDATSVTVGQIETLTNGATIDLTFNYDIFGSGKDYSVTHRLSQIVIHHDIESGSGKFDFTCHGINTHSSQCSTSGGDCTSQTQTFDENKLIGQVKGVNGFLTFFYKIFSSVWGLLVVILIPALYLIISSVIDIFKAATAKDPDLVSEGGEAPPQDNSSPNDALGNLSKEDLERLKKDLLEELMEKGGKKNE